SEEFCHMSNMKFTALASLAALAAPMAAQAEMVEMTETQMADVSGQGVLSAIAFNSYSPVVPQDYLPTFIDGDGLILWPEFNDNFQPFVAAGATNDQLIDNAEDFGEGIADIAFMGPFRALDLAAQGKSTALDFLFFPISAPLDVAGNVFDALNDGVVFTASRILTAPLNAVFGPVNRYVDGVTGRFEATVDGAAYAAIEVKGALITNAFAGASAAAG
ncbi:MAG TPA: hypothetical protein DDW98_11670, partial [Gammaproteobacteria bacterium]|nr:hypothetical protein [Gammaproteobacteria bacterium]